MTDKSHETQLAESISAMVDSEASELEMARVLKASQSDDEVRATWSRYHIARAAMRSELPAGLAPEGFASRISEVLADESIPATRQLSRLWLGLGRVAVAASVAGAVILGAQFYQQDPTVAAEQNMVADTSGNAGRALAPADASLPVGFNAPALSARPVSAQSVYQPASRRPVVVEPRRPDVKLSNEQVRTYLHQLLEQHTDHAAVNSASGVVPHARVPLIEEE
ncbi:sigma-E factor negative regulatory protein [Gilvimarinus algae]|uniref:Sigma-E factor negative regulatory protein n=1 Tax=Gilvimarinus algae TaxID=3058037 RepID=A0ABT8TFU8_9GAMM|nr:sigma-E factor negative regulatory protein [Gilvimarinus sp. SDUM040014]MDO3382967.1 sigma-E factor negative regulatory protein [Gilvimarinus sp. SDUM040014]